MSVPGQSRSYNVIDLETGRVDGVMSEKIIDLRVSMTVGGREGPPESSMLRPCKITTPAMVRQTPRAKTAICQDTKASNSEK